jgi:hypothetical protein
MYSTIWRFIFEIWYYSTVSSYASENVRFQSDGYEQNQSKKLTNVGP